MTEELLRNVLEKQILDRVLGPGYARELYVCSADASDEILDDDPSEIYCTGVLLPLKNANMEETLDVDAHPELLEIEGETDDIEDSLDDDIQSKDGSIGETNDTSKMSFNHIGLITCLGVDANQVNLNISYGKYDRIEATNVKINCWSKNILGSIKQILNSYDAEDNEVNALLDEKGLAPFSSCFDIDEDACIIGLKHILPIQISRLFRSAQDDLEKKSYFILNKFIKNNFYKRRSCEWTGTLTLRGEEGFFEINDDLKGAYSAYTCNGKKYLKVIVKNKYVVDSINFRSCLFQTVLKVSTPDGQLLSYTDPFIGLRNDEESNINEYVYREVSNFGKGVGCAVEWEENGAWIQTTYAPRCEVKKFSNEIENDVDNGIDISACCKLRNLSHWNDNDADLINKLRLFVNEYAQWCHHQATEAANEPQYQNQYQTILERQQELLDRLNDNIDYLQTNPEALMCFKLANTAMLIQMVISRDSNFRKNRLPGDIQQGQDVLNDMAYFENACYLPTLKGNMEPAYRPFQLAFLLMNVKSTFEDNDPYRKDMVDLIWFPTGGGKTEAYLALTALTIIARRRFSDDEAVTCGVSVIMRYTLRLLTTQQFERASNLICALDFLREKCPEFRLGSQDNPITIGLWIGGGTSPNHVNDLIANNGIYQRFLHCASSRNPFPVTFCPWCGGKLHVDEQHSGYNDDGSMSCLTPACHYRLRHGGNLPISYIDEVIYRQSPTLLFATVDKFAQLYRTSPAGMLGYGRESKSVDLIIQDELHLITGPLGSMVGMFEGVVEKMCSKNGRSPKIIASTATTRNTQALVRNLYSRKVVVFPAQGIKYDNNYFSHIEERALRCHLGIMPSGKISSVMTEVKMESALVLGRLKVIEAYLRDQGVDVDDAAAVAQALNYNGNLKNELDVYWTVVCYFNSLKDLGRSTSRVSQEIYEHVRSRLHYLNIPGTLYFASQAFDRRKKEFTSREDSSRIKDLLTVAETPLQLEVDPGTHALRIASSSNMDMVFASNMISVGIDIDRWNVMLMVGQPRSTSEYIQSSSRVARSHKGLVLNLLNPFRNREYSLFENYTSFHKAYYKYVEPLSATPLTLQTIHTKLLTNMVACYQKYITQQTVDNDIIDEMTNWLACRYHLDVFMKNSIHAQIQLIYPNAVSRNPDVMSSLREIDEDSYLMLNSVEYR